MWSKLDMWNGQIGYRDIDYMIPMHSFCYYTLLQVRNGV
jgi:hypothetical protein